MKANQVVTNIAQDFTKTEKAQGRANIDAAEQKGFVECYRRFNDGTWTDTWFKICELSPGTSSNYSYGYELSLKFVCTNNGAGDCPAESATMNMGCNFIPALNVGRCEVAWADHTVDDHAQCAITGVKVLTHRASNNYGPRDKCEVWVKTSQYFTYYTQMRVEALINAGNGCYRSNYSTPTMYILPWEFRNSMVTGTHTDPFNDADHPEAQGYGAEGWSEVWYPCETKTVMVDHAQNFTEEEKAQARANIGVSAVQPVGVRTYQGAGAYGPIYASSNMTTLNNVDGSIYCDYGQSGEQYGFFAPPPASGDNGKVLTAQNLGGSDVKVKWTTPIDWRVLSSSSSPNPTYVVTSQRICSENEADKIWGTVTFTTTSSGNFSLCPGNYNGYMSQYGSQCVNIGAVPTGYPMTYSFCFDSKGNKDITNLCIKGVSSASECTIRWLGVQLH